MSGHFSIFLSSETDMETYEKWEEALEVYKPYLEKKFSQFSKLSANAHIAFIPTIYIDCEGVKPRLWFDKKHQTIDFRPLINAQAFISDGVEARCNRLVNRIPEAAKKVHLFNLPDTEKELIRSFLESFARHI